MPEGDQRPQWNREIDPANVRPILMPGSKGAPRSVRDLRRLAEGLVSREEKDGELDPISRESELEVSQFDRIAWYSSFRRGPGWGIYIREVGVASLGRTLAQLDPGLRPEAMRFAFTKVLLHEYAHFLFDVATLCIERAVSRPLRVPHRALIQQGTPQWDVIEEGLCNAYALRFLSRDAKTDRVLKSRLEDILRFAPQGYRDFARYKGSANFDRGVTDLFERIAMNAGQSRSLAESAPLLFDDQSQLVSPGDVPVYLVREPHDERGYLWLYTALGSIHETPRFSKMLKKVPLEVQKSWESRRTALKDSIIGSGGNFHALTGKFKGKHAVGLSYGYRVLLQLEGDQWSAVWVGTHDAAYR